MEERREDISTRFLKRDFESAYKELSDHLAKDRSAHQTLMMRVKRLENLVKILIQFAVLGMSFAAVYWGLHFYNQGSIWSIVGIASLLLIFFLMLHETDEESKRIIAREAQED